VKKLKMLYFKEEVALHLVIADEGEASSMELGPDITAELNIQWDSLG
jgi:hypothetical protein